MRSTDKLRVAVIGRTGKGNYGHGLDTVWLGFTDRVEIVAVADPDDAGRTSAVKRLGARNAYADYRQLLAREKPQVVSVADRFLGQHRDMVVACAEAGASIFLEKPMARTLAEADEMVAACQRHHVKLAIAHQTRYSPVLARVKELIDSGRLGDLVELRGRGKEDRRGGGEDLMVLGTHLFDMMRFLAGDAKWCFAKLWQDGRPAQKGDIRPLSEEIGPGLGDRMLAVYGFDRGVTATFGTMRAAHGLGSRFALFVHGTKGVVRIVTGALPAAEWIDDPRWTTGGVASKWAPITSNWTEPETLKDAGGALGNRLIVDDLLAAIAEDREPKGGMHDGRAALEMILAVYESYRQGKPVELPLKTRQHPLGLM